MKNFCIITNQDKDQNYEKAERIKTILIDKGCNCSILPNVLDDSTGEAHYTDPSLIPDGTECAIILGGDGTVIQAAIDLALTDLPMLAVNTGNIGYMTEVDYDDFEKEIDKIINDNFDIEERIMLKTTEIMDHDAYSLNDIVIYKHGRMRLITISIYVNGKLMDTYCADGVIISTPTGSTGYNLSSGGPVMDPHTKATVVTPICPHSLNKRSTVLASSDIITVELKKTKENCDDSAAVSSDGRELKCLATGDKFTVCVPENTTKLIKLNDEGFYERMRKKLFQSAEG